MTRKRVETNITPAEWKLARREAAKLLIDSLNNNAWPAPDIERIVAERILARRKAGIDPASVLGDVTQS
jgi:hypothetical protein